MSWSCGGHLGAIVWSGLGSGQENSSFLSVYLFPSIISPNTFLSVSKAYLSLDVIVYLIGFLFGQSAGGEWWGRNGKSSGSFSSFAYRMGSVCVEWGKLIEWEGWSSSCEPCIVLGSLSLYRLFHIFILRVRSLPGPTSVFRWLKDGLCYYVIFHNCPQWGQIPMFRTHRCP